VNLAYATRSNGEWSSKWWFILLSFLGNITISHFILFCWKEKRGKLLVFLNCLCWLEVFVFLGCIDHSITIAYCNLPNCGGSLSSHLQDATLHFWSIIMSCPKQMWWSSILHWPFHRLVCTQLVITISNTSTTFLPLILITWYWNVI
jgi:hypothetical protein